MNCRERSVFILLNVNPIALILSGNLYLVDAEGRVIDTFDHDPEYSSLPVITGITEISNEAQIRCALQFVSAMSVDASGVTPGI